MNKRVFLFFVQLIFGFTAAANAQSDTIGRVLQRYGCAHVVPPATQENGSYNRVGAVANAAEVVGTNSEKVIRLFGPDGADFCVKSDQAMPTAQPSLETENFTYRFDASLNAKLELERSFKLINVEIGVIDRAEIKLTEFATYAAPRDVIGPMVRHVQSNPDCAPLLKKSRRLVITGVCQAVVNSYKFYFKAGAKVELVDAVINKVKANLGAKVEFEVGEDKKWVEFKSPKHPSDSTKQLPLVIGVVTRSPDDYLLAPGRQQN